MSRPSTSASLGLRTGRVLGGLTLALTLGLTMAGCFGGRVEADEEQTGKLDACGLLAPATAAKAIGADSVLSSEKSVAFTDSRASILSCEYSSADGLLLLFNATKKASQGEADAAVSSAGQGCDSSGTVSSPGVVAFVCLSGAGAPQAMAAWQGIVVHIAVGHQGTKAVTKAGDGLRLVIAELHKTLGTSSFQPK